MDRNIEMKQLFFSSLFLLYCNKLMQITRKQNIHYYVGIEQFGARLRTSTHPGHGSVGLHVQVSCCSDISVHTHHLPYLEILCSPSLPPMFLLLCTFVTLIRRGEQRALR